MHLATLCLNLFAPDDSNLILKIVNYWILLKPIKDIPVLLGPLLQLFSENFTLFKNMSCIKNGSSYMQIQYGNLVFRDMINFSAPMSLGKWATKLIIILIAIFKIISLNHVAWLKCQNQLSHMKNGIRPSILCRALLFLHIPISKPRFWKERTRAWLKTFSTWSTKN